MTSKLCKHLDVFHLVPISSHEFLSAVAEQVKMEINQKTVRRQKVLAKAGRPRER